MEQYAHNCNGFCFKKFGREWRLFLVYSDKRPSILAVPGGKGEGKEPPDKTLYREYSEEVSLKVRIEEHIRFLRENFQDHTRYFYLITKAFGLPGRKETTKNYEYDKKGVILETLTGKWYLVRYVEKSGRLKPTQRKAFKESLKVMAEEHPQFRQDLADLFV